MKTRSAIASRISPPLALTLLLLTAGCTQPAEEEPARMQVREEAPPVGYFKIDLSRSAEDAGRVIQVEAFRHVMTSGRPVAAAMEYLAIAYAEDEVLAAMPFSFPTETHREWLNAEGSYVSGLTIPVQASTTSLMLPEQPGMTRIDLLDGSGTVLASLDPLTAETTVAAAPSLFVRSAYAATEILFGHIEVITETGQLPTGYGAVINNPEVSQVEELNGLTPEARTKLTNALAQLPPTLRGSIARISIASYQNDGCDTPDECSNGWVGGDAYGNWIMLNKRLFAGDEDKLASTLAHEATHCFHALVDFDHDALTDPAANYAFIQITPEAEQAAKNARGRLLDGTISRVLRRLQSTAGQVAFAYKDYGATEYGSDGEAVRDAFKSNYGSTDPREDLAELVAMFVTNEHTGHAYCTQFQGLDNEIPPENALAFAKLNLARGLGLLDESMYEACVGNADPVDGEMIVMGSRKYENDLNVGMQQVSHEDLDYDWLMIRIQGVTDDAQLEIRARVRRADANAIGSPIGFYEMDTAGSYGLAADRLIPIAAQNVITFQRTDTSNSTELAAYTRISGGGFLLITDFSPELKKGYVFFVPFHSIIELEPPATDVLDVIWFQIEEE